MFNWLLIIHMYIGGQHGVDVFSVHQTEDDCVADARYLIETARETMRPPMLEGVTIECIYDVDGTEI